ncbi:MAG: hypothetical protein Q9174_005466, partial [Haloplaca sp. 1 TL-2023]
MILRFSHGLAILSFIACTHSSQPSAPEPVSAPLRELRWGQLNFLHTTDIHGWIAGHLQETVKDVLYIAHINQEGNGLYDGSTPKGKYLFDIFAEQHIDVVTIGNHELYKKQSAQNELLHTVPDSRGHYIASNLDVLDPASGERVPLAPRFKKFTTKAQGIRILAFGFLYDFAGNANNSFVEAVERTVQQKWFIEAIHDREVDLFLVAGHVPLYSPEYDAIFKAIREVQWDTPIQFFAGHLHIRDYRKYDSLAFGIESGRYMETVGFMSITGLRSGGKPTTKDSVAGGTTRATPKFSRRYIDNNLYSYHQHTGLNSSTFPTQHGLNVSAQIAQARKALDLDHTFGCAPQNYWTFRAPFGHESSIFTLLQTKIIPSMIEDPKRKNIPSLVFVNCGGIRFDIFKGPFTKDNTYAVSPFTTGFRYIKDVPLSIAKKLKAILNQEVPALFNEFNDLAARIPASEASFLAQNSKPSFRTPADQIPLSSNDNDKEHLTPGYTTHDDAGTDGDDTIHSPITLYDIPNIFETRLNFPTSFSSSSSSSSPSSSSSSSKQIEEPATVDIIYIDFIEWYMLLALKFLGTDYEQ